MVRWEPPIESVRLGNASVQTRVLADGSVETAKIATLAVTDAEIANATITKLKIGDQEVDIQRMLDPMDGTTGAVQNQNVSLTTTATSHASMVASVPTWAGTALVWAESWVQMTNSSGGNVDLTIRCVLDGTPTSGLMSVTIPDGDTGQNVDYETRDISSPGSTLTVETFASITSGTNSSNIIAIRIFAMFFR
jgi:hypothetical protein